MTNTTKTTKRDFFNMLLAINEVSARPELVEFINHELDLLAKKNASRSNGELTETQVENIRIASEIIDFMKSKGSKVTISDIRKHFGLSSQKVTPIMTKLVTENRVIKTIEKRVSYFEVA